MSSALSQTPGKRNPPSTFSVLGQPTTNSKYKAQHNSYNSRIHTFPKVNNTTNRSFSKSFTLPLYLSSTSSYACANSFSWEWFTGSKPGMKPAIASLTPAGRLTAARWWSNPGRWNPVVRQQLSSPFCGKYPQWIPTYSRFSMFLTRIILYLVFVNTANSINLTLVKQS